jgi:hypothetical protein
MEAIEAAMTEGCDALATISGDSGIVRYINSLHQYRRIWTLDGSSS